MATLKAMFKLFDGYSSTVNKIISGTDKATAAVGKASKGTDAYNKSLKNTASAAGVASSGLTKLIGTVMSLAAVKKGMDLTDTYTNTSARLSMITDNLEEQKELQNAVFAAAGRSRGSYVEMANATAKMKMLAGESFGSNEEALGFTELLQKSLKVSGASQGEQDSAFLQLTQAMASGKLQGDEFRSIMENAPMVANAISQYLGVTKGELKELSSDGAITADIIKGAMFNAADDINAKFSTMPMTFADVWQKIKNTGMQAFGDVFEKVNAMLNSDMGQAVINNLTGAIYMAAKAVNFLLDGIALIGRNLDILAPIILGVVTVLGLYHGTLLLIKGAHIAGAAIAGAYNAVTTFLSIGYGVLTGNTAAASAAQFVYNNALLACPITWIIGAVILLIAAFYAGVAAINHFTGATLSATGVIGGAIGGFAAAVINYFIMIYNYIAEVVNFFANVWKDPIAAVKILFYDLAVTVIGYVVEMAKSIETIINRIPGVNVQISAGLDNFKNGIEEAAAEAKDASGWEEIVQKKDFVSGADFANKGYGMGEGLADKAANLFSGFGPDGAGGEFDFSQFATPGSPATVKGTGKGGAVKVENEEDIEWMRKLAERDYVARISQNTLAPNIRVEFSGPITKEADVDGVTGHLAEQLKEMIAAGPEGVPA